MTQNSRYPYTHAADHIRMIAGYVERDSQGELPQGTKLSRSDASRIRREIAEIIGMDDEKLAKKIADRFLTVEKDISKDALKSILTSTGADNDTA